MKRLFAILLTVVVALSAFGCQNKAAQNSADEPTVPGASGAASTDSSTRDEPRHRATFDQFGDLSATHPYDYPLSPTAIPSGVLKNRQYQLDTEELFQNPELPTGCESVALTAALQYLKFDLEKTDIAENYLTYGEDVMWDYVGEPFEYDGAGIFPPGLTNTANIYLRTQKTNYVAYNTMGVPFEDLLKLIENKCPVVIWTTLDYEYPILADTAYEYKDKFYYWYELEHCVFLCGYDLDEGTVTINDPMEGIVTLDLEQMKETDGHRQTRSADLGFGQRYRSAAASPLSDRRMLYRDRYCGKPNRLCASAGG